MFDGAYWNGRGRSGLPGVQPMMDLFDDPTGDGGPVKLEAEAMVGTWILHYGLRGFGKDTRVGVVQLEPGGLSGGDNQYSYSGRWTVEDGELKASVEIVRRGNGQQQQQGQPAGTVDATHKLLCVAEAVTADLFAGRIRRSGFAEARLMLRRFAI